MTGNESVYAVDPTRGDVAQSEEVEIRRRDGAVFSLKSKTKNSASPFDVPGINTKATTQNILDAVRDSRTG